MEEIWVSTWERLCAAERALCGPSFPPALPCERGIIECEGFFLKAGPASPENEDLPKFRSRETKSGGEGTELALILLFVTDSRRQHKHFALALLN
ncbi:hypothetical protein F2P81_019128 [Scophthalmus maximus]|uniref:Uncharacterized protein n=1 Tax=Scophthalmus maximus TaxID=52904 RepID=A0A6A4SAB8_SCOMX|nr:hypothetical protein F2P81_019128 [Scophthalmus maximus]